MATEKTIFSSYTFLKLHSIFGRICLLSCASLFDFSTILQYYSSEVCKQFAVELKVNSFIKRQQRYFQTHLPHESMFPVTVTQTSRAA